MNIFWNADTYSVDFSFVSEYGLALLDLIDAGAGSSVLDLGCGNGALSRALMNRGYQVTGLDGSREFLRLARERYPEISFIEGDATDFKLEEPVDVVFSNAVFHWIDQDQQRAMLDCIYRALKPGGELVFECGGIGNNAKIHTVLKELFEAAGSSYEIPFYFSSIGEYAALLEQAGFQVEYALLFDRITELKGKEGLKEWMAMFLKTPFSFLAEEEMQKEVMEQAVERLKKDLFFEGKWHADYVRLRMKAIRPMK